MVAQLTYPGLHLLQNSLLPCSAGEGEGEEAVVLLKGERGEAAGDNGEASGHVASLTSKKGEQEGRIR